MDLYDFPDVALARLTDDIVAGEPTPDEETGDLLADGFHAYRYGSVVVYGTFDGRGAKDFGTADKAKAAFASL